MPSTPTIRASQAGTLFAFNKATPFTRVSTGQVLYIYNVAAKSIRTSQAAVLVGQRRIAKIQASQANVLVAIKGRINNPALRAWTFDLDGHEFYVLKLGDDKTLVYDISTGQWSWWSGADGAFWRANFGTNWQNSGPNARALGSNVVHGDDTHGVLWFLNPQQSYDTSFYLAEVIGNVRYFFPRTASAQIPVRGRDFVKCFEVYLNATQAKDALIVNKVTLKYSDDAGKTFREADQPVEINKELAWRSLGNMSPPGRIVTISDDGALSRLENLSVTNADTAAS